MHFYGARAQEEFVGDLTIGPPDGEELQHLAFPPREPIVLQLARGQPPQPPLYRLPQCRSSRNTVVGRQRPIAVKASRMASKSMARSASDGGAPSSGKSSAR